MAEKDGINFVWVDRVLVILLALLVVAFVGSGALLIVLRKHVGPSTMKPLAVLPEPRLEINGRGLQSLRARNSEELRTYGWIDHERGIVRVPIDVAMERIAKGARP